MIPRSPILLLTGAQTLAQCASPLPMRRHRPTPRQAAESMLFVHQVGYWSHFDPSLGVSSWPLPRSATLRQVHQRWRVEGLLLCDGQRGDLVVMQGADGDPERIGVLLDVSRRLSHAGRIVALRCDVLWGSAGPDGRVSAERQSGWLRIRHGVRFVPWYEGDDYRNTARAA